MNGRGAAAGVDNTQRRKWNKDEYAAKAAERLREEVAAGEDAKRAKVSANLGIVVRKPLNQQDMISRDYNLELKARVGTRTLVSPDNPQAAGFYCKETGKTLRDSISYLDHINGKRQQKALGMSMRVDRSTLAEVQAKFEEGKRRKTEEAAAAPSFETRVAKATEDEERERREKRERKAAERKQRAATLELEGAAADPEMLASMGFGGFGGRR